MRPCAVVPHYQHERQIGAVLSALVERGLPVIVVDDGSAKASVAALQSIVQGLPGVSLHCSPVNEGKGAAVLHGLGIARAQRYTHAVQVDADGQHCIADVLSMLECARAHEGALVSGSPVYDASVPGARLHGRKVSVFWTRVHTWSQDIVDPMCGFRVYPVDATLALAAGRATGRGMEFDIEIMVRAHWAGMPILFVPTPVTYPADGVSHFRMVRDNVRISAMHTRLFFGMLRRSPALLRRLAAGPAA